MSDDCCASCDTHARDTATAEAAALRRRQLWLVASSAVAMGAGALLFWHFTSRFANDPAGQKRTLAFAWSAIKWERLADLGAVITEKKDRGPKALAALVKSEIARLTPILKAASGN